MGKNSSAKKGLIIAAAIVALFALFISFMVHLSNNALKNFKRDSIRTVSNIPYEYSGLFHKNNRLSFENTTTSKTRNPISQFDYDGKFKIYIYRINDLNIKPLSKIIEETHNDNHITYDTSYYLLGKLGEFGVNYKAGVQDGVQLVHLNLFGDKTITLIKNDTIAYYNSMIKNFYIKYQNNTAQDFFIGEDKDWPKLGEISTEVMLKENHGNLYLVLMIAENSYTMLKPGTLLTLMSN